MRTMLLGVLLVLLGCANAPPEARRATRAAIEKSSFLAWKDRAFLSVVPSQEGRVRRQSTGEEWTAHLIQVKQPVELEPGMTVYVALPGTSRGFALGTVKALNTGGMIQVDGRTVGRADILVDDCPGGMVGGSGAQRVSVCPRVH